MSPSEFSKAVQDLGFPSISDVALFFGASDRTGRRWAVTGPPRTVEMCLVAMRVTGLTPPALAEAVGLCRRRRAKRTA